MNIKKVAAMVALVVASSAVQASGSDSISGIIRFTGEIVVGACDMPASEWYRHAGRQDGRSPTHAGEVPPRNGVCAGIADTGSVTFTPVRHRENGTVSAGIVTVAFN